MPSCAPTWRASRACWRTAPTARVRSPRRRLPTCVTRWVSVRRAERRTPRSAASARRGSVPAVNLAELELDLDVFSGPFDLLLTLVLREEVDLRELALAEVVVAYLDHLEERGELDLEVTSRLLLPGEELEELLELEPGEAAEELLERMLDARRYRSAAAYLREQLA